jgi:hypothetical protein
MPRPFRLGTITHGDLSVLSTTDRRSRWLRQEGVAGFEWGSTDGEINYVRKVGTIQEWRQVRLRVPVRWAARRPVRLPSRR